VKRGDLVLAAATGDYGKPRPHLVVQSDAMGETDGVTVVPLTSSVYPAPLVRVLVEPSRASGLRTVSQAMVDKIITIHRRRLGPTIGALDEETMQRVNRSLALWLGLV
jgi:mRNA interferase MazF